MKRLILIQCTLLLSFAAHASSEVAGNGDAEADFNGAIARKTSELEKSVEHIADPDLRAMNLMTKGRLPGYKYFCGPISINKTNEVGTANYDLGQPFPVVLSDKPTPVIAYYGSDGCQRKCKMWIADLKSPEVEQAVKDLAEERNDENILLLEKSVFQERMTADQIVTCVDRRGNPLFGSAGSN